MFSQPHRFEKFTYTTPTYCDFCQQLLWGFSKTGLWECVYGLNWGGGGGEGSAGVCVWRGNVMWCGGCYVCGG